MPEKTREEFTADGYFRTGDLGRMGGEIAGQSIPNNYVSIVGRGKDLIISGGFNVYPKEIEGFIDDYLVSWKALSSECLILILERWAWR